MIHWTVVGGGRVRLLGSEVGVGLGLGDSHPLDVDVDQEVQLSLHGVHLMDETSGGTGQIQAWQLHQQKSLGLPLNRPVAIGYLLLHLSQPAHHAGILWKVLVGRFETVLVCGRCPSANYLVHPAYQEIARVNVVFDV